MGDEPYTTQRETFTRTSSTASRHSTSPHLAAYAAERAKLLFGCYRRGDANDPDTYVAAVAAVLSRYDADLIREVTDPNTGISTSEKYMSFMPNAGELKVYCDGVASHRSRIQHLASIPALDVSRSRLPPPPPRPGDLANLFVRQDDRRYDRLVEMARREDERLWSFGRSSDGRVGIWIARHLLEDGGFASMPSVADVAKQAAGMRVPQPQQEAAE